MSVVAESVGQMFLPFQKVKVTLCLPVCSFCWIFPSPCFDIFFLPSLGTYMMFLFMYLESVIEVKIRDELQKTDISGEAEGDIPTHCLLLFFSVFAAKIGRGCQIQNIPTPSTTQDSFQR